MLLVPRLPTKTLGPFIGQSKKSAVSRIRYRCIEIGHADKPQGEDRLPGIFPPVEGLLSFVGQNSQATQATIQTVSP
jgi:hypothetical protein